MTDANGTEIIVGNFVRFVDDHNRSFNLGCVAAIMDENTVALTSPFFQHARAKDLIVLPKENP